jgi:glucosylceramidase
MILSCSIKEETLIVEIYETSASGNNLAKLDNFPHNETQEDVVQIKLLPTQKRQTITGFGGSFTESSAYLLNKVSKENRDRIIEAYFGESGAKYSLTRTHMNSCDFSISQYSYAPVADDKELKHFTVEEDKEDLIPMIKDAMKYLKTALKYCLHLGLHPLG